MILFDLHLIQHEQLTGHILQQMFISSVLNSILLANQYISS
jgi:hypothetical protein